MTLRDKVLQRLREALAHHETCEYSNCPCIGKEHAALLSEALRQVEAMDPREYELTREESVTLRSLAAALSVEE